ncbi:MAG: asparagine synthetase B family protein [Pseudomarimonas sp.]
MIAGVLDFHASVADAGSARAALGRRYQRLVANFADHVEPRCSGGAMFGWVDSRAAHGRIRQQPRLETDPLLVVADLRLDGRAALTDELGLAADVDDDTLIQACWRRWASECVQHLFGDFAFGVWCKRTQRLWLARDPLGQRPLFVRRSGQQLAFASSLRPLRALEGSVLPDPISLAHHLLNLPGAPERSAWQDIERIPAGHIVCFGADGKRDSRRYFLLQPPAASDQLSEAEWSAGFRERFTAAVEDRLSTDHPLAAMVSGGLDSSAVASMACHLRRGAAMRAYAGRFPHTPSCDEGQYLAALRGVGGMQLRDLDVSASSPLVAFSELLPALDEPVLLQNLHLWTTVYKAAQGDGVRVVLDGHDGDSALGRSASGDAALRAGLQAKPGLGLRVLDQLRGLRQRLRAKPPAVTVLDLLAPEFAHATQAKERMAAAVARRSVAADGDIRDRHIWQLSKGYSGYATERLSSVAAHFGIDPRHPFYDVRLLSWCVGLPPRLKERDGYSRWVLREQMAGVLPDALRWRAGKTSLSAQFHRAFAGADADLVNALLKQAGGPLAAYVDLAKARAVWERYQRQPRNQDSTPLWAIATLGLWLADS